MISREQWRRFVDHPLVEWGIFGLGVILIVAGIVVAPLPGPGGIFFIVPGLALVLKTSMWAKRRYVWFKRKQPKIGRWADWSLRRRSAQRREARRMAREDLDRLPAEEKLADPPAEAVIRDPPLLPPEEWSDREGRAN
jgi:hypothetical protein